MSNAFCTFIYGCDATADQGFFNSPRLSDEDQEVFDEIQSLCKHGDDGGVIGYHLTYTNHNDLLWWGQSYGWAGEGFGPVPELPSEEWKAKVEAEYAMLPEEHRKLMGPLRVQTMMGID